MGPLLSGGQQVAADAIGTLYELEDENRGTQSGRSISVYSVLTDRFTARALALAKRVYVNIF